MLKRTTLSTFIAALAAIFTIPSIVSAQDNDNVVANTKAVTIKIIGGDEVKLEQYPFMTALVERGANATQAFCGASVIAKEWVLTAAHCIEGTPANQIDVVTGTADLNNVSNAERVTVQRIVTHPDYNNGTLLNDIALLKLSKPVNAPRVAAAVGSQENLYSAGSPVSVAGWGNRSTNGEDFPYKLHAVELSVSDFANCSSAYGGLDESHLCAGVSGGGKDSCQGDSGGPLIARTNQGPVQVGIVSFGDECASADYPGVYTKVASFTDFIQQTVNTNTALEPVAIGENQIPEMPENENTSEKPDTNPEETPTADNSFLDVQTQWLEEFTAASIDQPSFAALEIHNAGEQTVMIDKIAISENPATSIFEENCTIEAMMPGDFCYIDLVWEPKTVESISGNLSFTVFDGATSKTLSFPYSANALQPVEFAETLDFEEGSFYTDNEQEWEIDFSEANTGDSALVSEMPDTDWLQLLGEFDYESDYSLNFSYQLEGVNCYIYIADEPAYELSAADDWQTASIDVPQGSDVRWEFRSVNARSSEPKKIMLDGMHVHVNSTTDEITTGAVAPSAALPEDTTAGSNGPLAVLAILGFWFSRRRACTQQTRKLS